MGSCGIVRGPGHGARAGALRAAVGVVLLGLGLSLSVPARTACAPAAALQSLTQPQYNDTDGTISSAGFLSPFVKSFLHTVQRNPFPAELILKMVHDFEQGLSDEELIKEALVYEVGFLVCAAIGVLYIVLMPVVGFFLACCRCCGNCGGKMYQKQTSSIQCRRRTLYWSVFVTTAIILAGNICMFRSNEALHVSVAQSPPQLNTTIGNIHTFLTAVPQEIFYVVNASHETIQEVNRNLDDIGPQLGTEIQERFMVTLGPALQPVRLLNQETRNISVQLNELDSSLAQLRSSMSRVQDNVTDVKNSINRTLSKPTCVGCAGLESELQRLTLDTSVAIPSLSEFQTEVDKVILLNLTSKIQQVESHFNSLPQRVIDDTKDVVQKSKQLLADIGTQISQFSSEIPLSGLTNAQGTLNQVQGEMVRMTSEVARVERIRWSVFVALCCAVLLVVVCNLLGLVLGPLGLRPKADPTKRSCTADCGGTFFMMGAGFSFLFSWLFMIVVLLLFLVGGNTYTMICRPWNDGQLLKFVDSSGFIPDIGQALGMKTNISLSDIYSDCEEDKTLWTTLHLNEVLNLEEILNVSKYTDQIQKQFEDTDITLSAITLLSPELKGQLSSFSGKANNLNSTAITQQINDLARINLNTTADELDLAASATNAAVQDELRNEANNLRQIQASIETTIIPQLETLNSTVKRLLSLTKEINGTVGEVLRNVGAAQDFLNTNTTQIVKTVSRSFLDCQLGYFNSYADWANRMITQQVGRCRPVAGALDSVEIILCSNAVASLNAFWFSLGWCMIFLIPSIIFSIKLAKYYRKMNSSDVYE
ncbi:putative prominin-1-A-like [Scophthalmus maximus]|uniref:Putative prominin-1-A-like n=1 Tax=Scophthalmus maximus TaxID=52904 RepID=A0A2U9CE99_SCOMX|nr:putative prominin-1-A-like [Scophthalmus maximus]